LLPSLGKLRKVVVYELTRIFFERSWTEQDEEEGTETTTKQLNRNNEGTETHHRYQGIGQGRKKTKVSKDKGMNKILLLVRPYFFCQIIPLGFIYVCILCLAAEKVLP